MTEDHKHISVPHRNVLSCADQHFVCLFAKPLVPHLMQCVVHYLMDIGKSCFL